MAFDKVYALVGINIYFIVLMFNEVIKKWNEIPDVIPSHYNIHGEPDRKSSKNILYFVPSTAAVLLILLLLASKRPTFINFLIPITEKNRKVVYENTRYYIFIVLTIFVSYLRVVNASLLRQKPMSISSLFSSLITIIVVTFFYIPYIKKAADEADNAPEEKSKEKSRETKKGKVKEGKVTNGRRNNKKKRY